MVRRLHKKPMKRTEGRSILLRILSSETQQALVARLHKRGVRVKQQAVSAWVRGEARPEPHFRDGLERVLGIPREAWYTAGELAIARGRELAGDELAATGTDGE